MKTPTELQLRNIALVLTAVVLLQLVWGGARLFLVSDPEPVLPAEASLRVEDIRFAAAQGDDQSQALASRPVFWQGRQPYTPPADGDSGEPEKRPRNTEINGVALKGVYAAGTKSGVIVSYKDERHRLKPEETIAGWTFSALKGTGAVFTYGDESRQLPLEHALSAPSAKDKHKKAAKPEAADHPKESNNQDKTGE